MKQSPSAPAVDHAPQRACLVTGGAGFIGSHLVERLIARGDRVMVVDNLSTGRRTNLQAIDPKRLTFVNANVSQALSKFKPGEFSEIYHLAAAVGVRLVIEQPIHTIETNVLETSALLQFASKSNTPTLLASTSEVYGKGSKTPFSEDDDVVYGPTIFSRWSYACSKAIDEYLALAYFSQHRLPVTVVRFFNTVGPRQVGEYGMVLPRFVAAALSGQPLEVHGDGRQSRCFCDVRDVVGVLPMLLADPACAGRVFNLGSDRPIQIGELAQLVRQTLGSTSPIIQVPYEEVFGSGFDDLRDRRPDLTRICQAVGFHASIPLAQTIRDLAEDIKRREATPAISTSAAAAVLEARLMSPQLPRAFSDSPIAAHPPVIDTAGNTANSAIDLLNTYAHIFIAAFVVTLLVTPLVRKLAEAGGVVDRPDFKRKAHTQPIPYLGGLAVFLGLLVAIGVSYLTTNDVPASFLPVPMAVVIGMVAITFTGLADDVWGWDPRLKIAGQLVAAAALAIENVGVNVAGGVLSPIFGPPENLVFHIPTPFGHVTFDVIYWTGTALIALFVLGGCNAANLIDGLDGLLSGVTAIVAVGLLAICLLMAPYTPAAAMDSDTGVLTGARIVLCVGLLGAVLGFLPHNFKPASIFLGDSGSLLLGYMCVVIILMLGEHGQTHLVFAGLIVFAVPIIDTMLAIIRRKLAGTAMSAADDQHLHHQLKRALGGVRRAVLTLYAMGFVFAVIGVTLAALVLKTNLRVRAIYAIALVLFSLVGVVAVKAARRHQRIIAAANAAAARTVVREEIAESEPRGVKLGEGLRR